MDTNEISKIGQLKTALGNQWFEADPDRSEGLTADRADFTTETPRARRTEAGVPNVQRNPKLETNERVSGVEQTLFGKTAVARLVIEVVKP